MKNKSVKLPCETNKLKYYVTHFCKKKQIWLAVYSRSNLIGVTYIHLSLIHWPVHNIPDTPTRRYFVLQKISQKVCLFAVQQINCKVSFVFHWQYISKRCRLENWGFFAYIISRKQRATQQKITGQCFSTEMKAAVKNSINLEQETKTTKIINYPLLSLTSLTVYHVYLLKWKRWWA